MISDAALAAARRLQESSFRDSLELGEDVVVKGQYAETTERVPKWSGKGLVQPSAGSRDPVLVGGQLVQQQTFRGKIPVGVAVEPGWVVRVAASSDPNLVGREFYVRELYPSSFATCTYFGLEET